MVEAVLRVVIIIAIGALGGLMLGAGARDSGKMLHSGGLPKPRSLAQSRGGGSERGHSSLGKDCVSCHVCGA